MLSVSSFDSVTNGKECAQCTFWPDVVKATKSVYFLLYSAFLERVFVYSACLTASMCYDYSCALSLGCSIYLSIYLKVEIRAT